LIELEIKKLREVEKIFKKLKKLGVGDKIPSG